MAKKVVARLKLEIPAGKATPAPPVGPILGQYGLKIMDFCQSFNAQTKDKEGMVIPVKILVFEDKTFSFVIKSPSAANLLKRAAGIAKASPEPNKEKVGKLTRKEVQEIAKLKMKDLNALDLDGAVKIIEGTARSMGIEVVE